ncbi:hypothetical protein SAMN05442782_0899 [Streptomyces sp. OK228]|nr:hypothetical protein SAMN05442782_0899 [Streptomyces sp. OK228]
MGVMNVRPVPFAAAGHLRTEGLVDASLWRRPDGP